MWAENFTLATVRLKGVSIINIHRHFELASLGVHRTPRSQLHPEWLVFSHIDCISQCQVVRLEDLQYCLQPGNSGTSNLLGMQSESSLHQDCHPYLIYTVFRKRDPPILFSICWVFFFQSLQFLTEIFLSYAFKWLTAPMLCEYTTLWNRKTKLWLNKCIQLLSRI